MLKLRELTLISLLLLMVVVGCSSSDQAAIDKGVSATLTAQKGVIETAVASGLETVVADNVEPTATVIPTATSTPEPPPTSTPEAVIDAFIPTIYDAQAAFGTDLSEEKYKEIIHAHFTGRWLLHLLSRNEVGSRKEFQSFAAQGDDFLFGYKLNRAMQQRIDSGDLPDWVHNYFVDPPDEEHALVACTAYFYTKNNPTFWIRFGHSMCEKQMISWLRDGGTESWTEWLINVPNPY